MSAEAERIRAPRADAERNRVRILEAAAKVFASQGVDATLSAVAQEAGVGIGTIYRRYPDKGALLAALHDARVEQLLSLTSEASALQDPWDGLQHYLWTIFTARAGDRGLGAILMANGDHDGELARRLGFDVERLVSRARESGRLRDGFAATDIPLLVAMIGAVADMTSDFDGDLWRRYAGLILDSLQPGVAPLDLRPPARGDMPTLLSRMR